MRHRVCGCRQRGSLNGGAFVAPVVPQDNLSRVRPTHHQVGVKLCKPGWHHLWLEEERIRFKCISFRLNLRCIKLKRMSLMPVVCLAVVLYLAVENVLRCAFLVLQVPDQCHSVGLMGSILIIVIWSHQQLRILKGRWMSFLDAGRSSDTTSQHKGKIEPKGSTGSG